MKFVASALPAKKMFAEFLVGGLASCIAEAATLPIDTLKVRMQIQPHSKLLDTVAGILKYEGVQAFFKGFEPAMIRQLIYGSMR